MAKAVAEWTLLGLGLAALVPGALIATFFVTRSEAFDFYETWLGYVTWMSAIFLAPLLGAAAFVGAIVLAAVRPGHVAGKVGAAGAAGLIAVAIAVWAWIWGTANIWPT